MAATHRLVDAHAMWALLIKSWEFGSGGMAVKCQLDGPAVGLVEYAIPGSASPSRDALDV
ncbi:MAG: hypothetical protein ACRDQH_10895 [Pseudonocardiaceae bacterium]